MQPKDKDLEFEEFDDDELPEDDTEDLEDDNESKDDTEDDEENLDDSETDSADDTLDDETGEMPPEGDGMSPEDMEAEKEEQKKEKANKLVIFSKFQEMKEVYLKLQDKIRLAKESLSTETHKYFSDLVTLINNTESALTIISDILSKRIENEESEVLFKAYKELRNILERIHESFQRIYKNKEKSAR
jgi:hypothetical protein